MKWRELLSIKEQEHLKKWCKGIRLKDFKELELGQGDCKVCLKIVKKLKKVGKL